MRGGAYQKRQNLPFLDAKARSENNKGGRAATNAKNPPTVQRRSGSVLNIEYFFRFKRRTSIRLQFAAVENFTFVAEVFPKQLIVLQKEVGMGRIVFRERDGAAVRVQDFAFDLFMAGDVEMPV